MDLYGTHGVLLIKRQCLFNTDAGWGTHTVEPNCCIQYSQHKGDRNRWSNIAAYCFLSIETRLDC